MVIRLTSKKLLMSQMQVERLIQQAISQVLTPIFEQQLSDNEAFDVEKIPHSKF